MPSDINMSIQDTKTSVEAPFRKELLPNIADGDGHRPEIPLLPATYRNHHKLCLVSDSVHAFLETEFNLARLNRIHDWLWICGLPTSPRTLHYQQLKNREIVISELLDLHLVWSPTRILIKPLPRFLLSRRFWHLHICPSPELYQSALGFVQSYIALIEREIDFKIAIEKGLLPVEITWSGWLVFAEEVLTASSPVASHKTNTTLQVSHKSDTSSQSSDPKTKPHYPVNPRFYYGELRLGRLNWIYRLVLGKPRGYLSGCTTYGAFMRENTNSLITLFAYTTIVLSAMQVGLGTQWLAEDYAFGMASYVFSVFAILAPLLAIVALVMILAVLFTINLLRTLRIRKKKRLQGAGV